MQISRPAFVLTLALVIALIAAGIFIYRVIHTPGKSYRGKAPPLSEVQMERRARLQSAVRVLASRIGERNLMRPEAYTAAADYIIRSIQEMDKPVYRETYHFASGTSDNIVVDIPGRARVNEIIVVGAHYDTVPGSPGANDNASGVSVLLELIRVFQPSDIDRSVRFVAFANEESPFFGTEAMGSLRHLRNAEARHENIVAMLSLETVGAYSDKPDSQHYPLPFSWFYPHTGNFIGFVADTHSRQLLHTAIEAFRSTALLPSEGVAAPRFIPDIRRSDHFSYWQAGIPALMITDTANFRYPQYHDAADTIDVIDFNALTRLVDGLIQALLAIANSP